jgi:phytoene dehydrogenase-like protein
MSKKFDVVIIGAGHNGLTTAAYLAKKGLTVGVYEARNVIGGAAVTEEFHPGFRNSTASYLVGMLSPKVVDELGLLEAGLKIVKRPANDFLPLADGRYLLNETDKDDEFLVQLDALCPGDAAGYTRMDEDLKEVVGTVADLMDRTPPNLGGGFSDIMSAIGAGLKMRHFSPRAQATLARLMTMSAAEFMKQYCKGDAILGAYAYLASVGSFQSVSAPGSAYVILHHSFGQTNSEKNMWGHAIGGMGAVSDAIAKVAKAAGVIIEVNAPVAQIMTRNGEACGIILKDGHEIEATRVIANTTPKVLYEKLVPQELLPEEFKHTVARHRSHSATLRMNVALSELPDFTCIPGKVQAAHHGSSILIAPSIEYLEDAYDDAKKGGWSKNPAIEMWISSTVDPTLAPAGKHVASLFCQHFHQTLSDGRDWDAHKEAAADAVVATMTKYAPNFASSIIARQVLSPKDLEQKFGLTGGDIFHGSLQLDQIFAMRPVPGYADYRTPVPKLYLCGSGAHPGGGVTGIPGRNAAREVLKDINSFKQRKTSSKIY